MAVLATYMPYTMHHDTIADCIRNIQLDRFLVTLTRSVLRREMSRMVIYRSMLVN